MNKIFSSPASFRQSLENRLQTVAKETGMDLQRIRRKVAFERFLARLFSKQPYPWILKGGYALEIRCEVARATKDLDLGTRLKIEGTPEEQQEILLEKLRDCSLSSAHDHFEFRIESAKKQIEAAPYGGFRFPIQSVIAGKLFVSFSLDVGFGDAITPPIQEVEGSDWLGFCGVSPAKFEIISLEQQFAEKIHAMTVDRGDRENSRVKDLVDVVLLIETGLDQKQVTKALANTFGRHGKTVLPSMPPELPSSWRQPFSDLAQTCGLNSTFDQALEVMSIYWDELS